MQLPINEDIEHRGLYEVTRANNRVLILIISQGTSWIFFSLFGSPNQTANILIQSHYFFLDGNTNFFLQFKLIYSCLLVLSSQDIVFVFLVCLMTVLEVIKQNQVSVFRKI